MLLGSLLLLMPAIGAAQTDGALPDAPSAVAASARMVSGDGASMDTEPARDQNSDVDANPVEEGSFGRGEQLVSEQSGNELSMQDTSFVYEPREFASRDSEPVQYASAGQGITLNLNDLFGSMDRPAAYGGVTPSGVDQGPEHYHWKGLFAQSFAFFGVENSFRLMTDHFFRQLTADGPFWHNYIASLDEWNWRRWDDGDDFLVAYIAHPMQGAVTEFIEIQNSPKERALRINDGKAYWKSRMKALAWNTLYSTDQKIGPLGEAALGAEGGYDYIIGCAYPCPTYKPGLYKVTNNTGWVKLVTTPVVGTLWTSMEDALDHYISDRVQDKFPDSPYAKILRGSLNPCRTMANFLRWRKPWYRDFQPEKRNVYLTHFSHVEPGDEDYFRHAPRFELFPHYNVISLPVNTLTCSHCRESVTGYGAGFSSRLNKWVDFDTDLNYMSKASALPSDRAGGDATLGTFGFRSGWAYKHYSIKAAIRPGFLSYDHAYETTPTKTGPTPQVGQITHFVAALAINGDININRHLALRGVIGNTPVRYRDTYENRIQDKVLPYLSWVSPKIFLTNENWTYQTGAVLRF